MFLANHKHPTQQIDVSVGDVTVGDAEGLRQRVGGCYHIRERKSRKGHLLHGSTPYYATITGLEI